MDWAEFLQNDQNTNQCRYSSIHLCETICTSARLSEWLFQRWLALFLDNFTCLTRAMETLLPHKLHASTLQNLLVTNFKLIKNRRLRIWESDISSIWRSITVLSPLSPSSFFVNKALRPSSHHCCFFFLFLKLGIRSNVTSSFRERKCLKIILFLHTILTLSPGFNPTTPNDMDIEFVDVWWWFFWHVTSVFKRFVRSGVHVTKRLGTLLKQNRKYCQLGKSWRT